MMNSDRKNWNERQKLLQTALTRGHDHTQTLDLFLMQHASLHTTEMSNTGGWSFADEVLTGLTETGFRHIPSGGEHSIAWIFWHLARIEDVTMNLLVAGSPQVLSAGDWHRQLQTQIRHTGNAMDAAAVATLSAEIDLEALQAYRNAVGRRTREIVRQIQPAQLKQKTPAARIEQIRAEGAVLETAEGILAYWGGRTVAGLLLMPPTRHNFLHLNEALRLRQKRR